MRRTRKKSRKQYGHRTMGTGYKRRNRGKGKKGGKGNAWCKHLWVKTIKFDPDHFGKHGFHNPTQEKYKTINVGLLCEISNHILKDKKGAAIMEGDAVKIDLAKLGIGKVLGAGRVSRKLIILGKVSDKAKQKIEAAGGKVM